MQVNSGRHPRTRGRGSDGPCGWRGRHRCRGLQGTFLLTSVPLEVSVLVDGQNVASETTFSKATATPYWKYSTLLGGGRGITGPTRDSHVQKKQREQRAEYKSRAAFLRCAC